MCLKNLLVQIYWCRLNDMILYSKKYKWPCQSWCWLRNELLHRSKQATSPFTYSPNLGLGVDECLEVSLKLPDTRLRSQTTLWAEFLLLNSSKHVLPCLGCCSPTYFSIQMQELERPDLPVHFSVTLSFSGIKVTPSSVCSLPLRHTSLLPFTAPHISLAWLLCTIW